MIKARKNYILKIIKSKNNKVTIIENFKILKHEKMAQEY